MLPEVYDALPGKRVGVAGKDIRLLGEMLASKAVSLPVNGNNGCDI